MKLLTFRHGLVLLASSLIIPTVAHSAPNPHLSGYIWEWTRWTRNVDFTQDSSWQVAGPRSGSIVITVPAQVYLDISCWGSAEKCPWTSEFAELYDKSGPVWVSATVSLDAVNVATFTKHLKSDAGGESWYTINPGQTFYRFVSKDHDPYLDAVVGGH